MKERMIALALLLSAVPMAASAGGPEVIAVRATEEPGGTWRFDVTVAHADTGWDHYANGWRVFDPDGNELGYRELLHPHVTEQPFTRALSGVVLPSGLQQVLIRAEDSVHGPGAGFRVLLPAR